MSKGSCVRQALTRLAGPAPCLRLLQQRLCPTSLEETGSETAAGSPQLPGEGVGAVPALTVSAQTAARVQGENTGFMSMFL